MAKGRRPKAISAEEKLAGREAVQMIMEELEGKMVAVDEQERQLEELFSRFSRSGKGDSVVVTGERGSGRSTIVERVAEKKMRAGTERNHIYVGQLGSDTSAQQAIVGDGNEMAARVIIVEDADELSSRSRQTLLYSMLDATRTRPWLVVLMVEKQDFVSLLEKRVRSRLSTNRITFETAFKYVDFESAMCQFLNSDRVSDEWVEFIEEFMKNEAVKRDNQYMFELSSSYASLKSCVAVFLGWLLPLLPQSSWPVHSDHAPSSDHAPCSDWPLQQAVSIWQQSVETIVPSVSPLVQVLHNVSLRTFCVFLCVLRRLEHSPQGATVTYGKVRLDYLHLTNRGDPRMRVSHDVIISKELDSLCQLRVLIDHRGSAAGAGAAYRRVSLHADPLTLSDAVKKRTLPMSIREWYKSIPTS